MRDTAPFWSLATLVVESVEPAEFQVSLEDMLPHQGRLIDGALSRYEAKGTPFAKKDVLFGKLRPYLAKYWLADRAGTAGGDIHVYRPAESIDPRFLSYLVGSRPFVRYAEAASKGVKMPRVEWMGLREYVTYRPHRVEQQRIADYLDRETAEIDAMIRKLNELAETLKIRRSAVIASIAGINRAKEARPLQWLATLTTGSTPSGGSGEENFAAEGAVGWVTPEDLQTTLALTRFPTAGALDQLTVVPPHSTLVCGIGASVGKLGFAEFPVTTNQQVTAVVPRDGIHGRYLYYALAAEKEQLLANTVTTTLPIINNSRLGSLTIKFCSPAEQERIANYLDDVTSKIDAMLAKTAELKGLLLERRSALITDVVTGRKDPA